MADLIEIAGDYGSGGGAILRVAIGLSATTGKPIHVYKLRAKRKNPGLRVQHLEGVKAVAELCNAELKGAELGSTEIEFYPGKIRAKELDVKIGTAGSIGLLFQSLKLPASQADGKVDIRVNGGADFGKWSPPLLYIKNVLLPVLERMGYRADINISRHGFYPVGDAKAEIRIYPCRRFKSIKMEKQGEIEVLKGISIASKHLKKPRVADRQAESAREVLKGKGFEAEIKPKYVDAACPGSGIVLWARTSSGIVLGSDSLGERGKPSEKVGEEAAQSLVEAIESGATVDKHLSDQLLPFIALAGNSSYITPNLTEHTKTNIWVIEKFLDKRFSTEEISGGVKISCPAS